MKKLILFIMMIGQLYASDTTATKILTSTPISNFGTEFWVSIPPIYTDESGGYDNSVKIYITAKVKTSVFVEIPGKGFSVMQQTVPNDVIVFNIDPGIAQPFVKSGSAVSVPEKVYSGAGIHVYSDQPLACYVVVCFKHSSDGFLAIPVSSIGKEYIVATFNQESKYEPALKLPNTTCIIAAYNDTQVQFTLGGNPETQTAGGMKPAESKTWSAMRRGDVLAISSTGGESDLSGSKVVSNKPVAVVSGNFCANIPTGNKFSDYIVEMDLPTHIWGNNYIVPKVPNRKYPSIIRIFAKEENTNVFRDGQFIGNIKKSGGIDGEAFITMRASKYTTPPTPPRSVSITANKPIGVTFYNTGIEEDGTTTVQSDPFMMALTPIEQFQTEILFCTPDIQGGTFFNENYLNFVYESDKFGNVSDEYEITNVIGGMFTWKKLTSFFPGTGELVDTLINNKLFAVKTLKLPNNGVYMIRSKTKQFAAYSFGFGENQSYGYPTAAGFVYIVDIDSIPPVPTYTVDSCGNVTGATVTDMPEDSKIRSNMAFIVIDPIQSYNYNFTFDDFIPGEARTVNWGLKIIDPSKDGKAVLLFVDRRGNETTITIKYNADSNPFNIDLVSPKDSSDNQDTILKFVWNKVALTQYRLMIDEKPGFKTKLRLFDLGDTIREVSGLRPLTTYYWKVLSLRNDTILGSSKTWSIKTKFILSVDDLTLSQAFSLNPNPATDFIEIDLTRWAPLAKWSPSVEIRIFNALGEIQTTPSLCDTPPWKGGEKVRIDVSGLAPGMYFVRMGDRVSKFIKL